LFFCASDACWRFLSKSKFERNYDKIAVGMALSEVETLMRGQGRELEQAELPRYPPYVQTKGKDHAVIDGDQFYKWTGPAYMQTVIIGIRDCRVCDKYYWEASL
jgi:hypothetical protein